MNTHTEQKTILAVCDYYEAEGIMESTGKIAEQVNSWYRNTDITDVKVLAAAVMEYGFYTSLPDYSELLQNKEFYYPTIPIEYQGYVSCEELAMDESIYGVNAEYFEGWD